MQYKSLIDDLYNHYKSEYNLASKDFFKKKQLWKNAYKHKDIDSRSIPEYVAMQEALEYRQKLAIIRASLKKIVSVLEVK